MKKEELRKCKVSERNIQGEKPKQYSGHFHKWFDHMYENSTEQCAIVELENGEIKTFGLHNSKITFLN